MAGIFGVNVFNDDIFNTGIVVATDDGASGGSAKSVGAKSLAQQQLGERPHKRVLSEITAKLQMFTRHEAVGKLSIKVQPEMKSQVSPWLKAGVNYCKIRIQTRMEIKSEYLSIKGETIRGHQLDRELEVQRTKFFLNTLRELAS